MNVDRMQEVGQDLHAALVAFMPESNTPTPVRVEPHDQIVDRDCACGGTRAVRRPNWDGSIRTICLDCGNEVGRTCSGEIDSPEKEN